MVGEGEEEGGREGGGNTGGGGQLFSLVQSSMKLG